MTATASRRAQRPGSTRARALLGETPPSAAALGAALVVAALYAAFARGSIGIPDESRQQVIVAAIALGALAALLYSRDGVRMAAAPGALAGVALIAGFAAWAALSITWSIAPDQSWLEANRALSYALVAGLGIALGASLPRPAEKVALGLLFVALVIAVYSLAGKLFPWFNVPGLIDLNQTSRFSRLRAPMGYWNALAMVCVLGIFPAVRAATEGRYADRRRVAAVVSLVPLLIVLALTYSRGGLIVFVAGVLLMVGLGPERLRLVAALGAGLAGALPAILVAFLRDDLTTDGLPVSARTDDGLLMLVGVAVGVAIAVVLARMIVARGGALVMTYAGQARLKRAALVAAVVVPVIVLGALAVSDRGIGGTISHQADEFTKAKFDPQNDPARVLRTNSGNRWVWWEEAVGAFSDRPFVGHGAGSFPLVHRAYRHNGIEVKNAHSVPLEFLAETGLIGALLALGGLALLGLAAVRNTLAREPGTERGYAVALLAGSFAFAIHLWVDWDWEIPGVMLPVLAVLGALAARPRGGPVLPAARHEGRRGLVLAAGAVATAVVIALAALPAISDSLTSSALSKAASGTKADLDAANRKAALAKRLNPLAVEPLFVQASVAERGNRPAAAAGLLAEAVERQPDNPATWNRLGRFQVLVDDDGGAVRSLLNVTRLDPIQGLRGSSLFIFAYDPARSASATGTPLPERLGRLPRPAPAIQAPFTTPGAPATPAPQRTTPTPAPTPAPRPTPTPAPKRAPSTPKPQGDPFRLEG